MPAAVTRIAPSGLATYSDVTNAAAESDHRITLVMLTGVDRGNCGIAGTLPGPSTSTMDVHARADPAAPVKYNLPTVEFHFQRRGVQDPFTVVGQIDLRLAGHLTRKKFQPVWKFERVNRRIHEYPAARHQSHPKRSAASSFSNPASTTHATPSRGLRCRHRPGV